MHPVVRIRYGVEGILSAAVIIAITALATYGACEAVSAMAPGYAAVLGNMASLFVDSVWDVLLRTLQILYDLASAVAATMSAGFQILQAMIPPTDPPNCHCVHTPPDWRSLYQERDTALSALQTAIANALWLAIPLGVFLFAWAIDRLRPRAHDGWYLDKGTLEDVAATSGELLRVTLEFGAWVGFFTYMYKLGAVIWAPLELLLTTYAWVWISVFSAFVALPGASAVAGAIVIVLVLLSLVLVVVDATRAALAAEGLREKWQAVWTAAWAAVLRPIAPLLALVNNLIRWAQEETIRRLMGSVHPAFPRQPEHVARLRANERREAIKKYIDAGKLPVLRTEYRLAPNEQRKFREHAVIHQVEEQGPPKLVNEFLEFPPGSAMVVKQPCLSEGPEEAVGQYVRLNYEKQLPVQRNWWQRLWAFERPEEIIVPLLARVVDVAILADRYADGLRRESDWPAKPFYERIYAEYRPLPFPLQYLLRPLIGDGLPARVVIETHYEEVFSNALFGRGAFSTRYTNWFGIGIQIQKPRTPEANRIAWAKPQPQCRRLKSHVASVLSDRIDVTFVGPPGAPIAGPPPRNTVQRQRVDALHIMPSGPLADGCPSVHRPEPYPRATDPGPGVHPPPPPLPSDTKRVQIPLPPRGVVSNAPPAWFFPARDRLFADCQGNCLKSQIQTVQQRMTISHSSPGPMSQTTLGETVQQSSLMPRRYRDPNRKWLYRRVWSGVFYDPDLALWNRFPLFGCSYTGFEGWPGKDLRGAFAKTMFVGWRLRRVRRLTRWLRGMRGHTHREPRAWSRFGGVFVSAQGPERAANLLLPEPLLYDYLNHLAQRDDVMKALRAGECKGPAFVPKPQEIESR